MRMSPAWVWILFLIAGGIYFVLYFSGGRTSFINLALGIAFLLLGLSTYLRGRKHSDTSPRPPSV